MKNPEICPYCGASVSFEDSSIIYGKSYGMVYICSNFPLCDAYVGVHRGTNTSLGRLANRELRELKKQAHASFDILWKSKRMTRQGAYAWLSRKLKTQPKDTHIGYFDTTTAKRCIEVCKEYLKPEDEVKEEKETVCCYRCKTWWSDPQRCAICFKDHEDFKDFGECGLNEGDRNKEKCGTCSVKDKPFWYLREQGVEK